VSGAVAFSTAPTFAVAGAIELTIDGAVHRGWRSAKITIGIEHAAGEFSLEMAERWSRSADGTARRVRPGAPCSLSLDGEVVVEGYIDTVEGDYDEKNHVLRATGREKTGDLVDCAAVVNGPHEFRGLKLDELCRRLCRPYGVTVTAEVDVGRPFDRFAIQPGEQAWDAIERACRQRAILAFGDGRGRLLLTQSGRGGTGAGALKLGGKDGNIRRARAEFDWKQRRSLVVVRGQGEGASVGEQLWDATDPGAPRMIEGAPAVMRGRGEARATDPEIDRYRPQVVIAEAAGQGASFAERAAWEVRVRAGRSIRVHYTVPGWRGRDGALWRPNTRVEIEDGYLRLAREMVIASVTWSLTAEQGSLTEIEVLPVDAYSLLAEPERRRGGDAPPGGRLEQSTDGGRNFRRVRSPASEDPQ